MPLPVTGIPDLAAALVGGHGTGSVGWSYRRSPSSPAGSAARSFGGVVDRLSTWSDGVLHPDLAVVGEGNTRESSLAETPTILIRTGP